MLEIASHALVASSAAGVAALFHGGVGRPLRVAGCFLCSIRGAAGRGWGAIGAGVGSFWDSFAHPRSTYNPANIDYTGYDGQQDDDDYDFGWDMLARSRGNEGERPWEPK